MKIAIITHYYNSNNYGGVLQAYALCRWLNSQGYNAEQICFDIDKSKSRFGLKQMIIRLIKSYKTKRYLFANRRKYFTEFRDHIPHSKKVYNSATIKECANDYDLFITGSDQVWNMEWFCDSYFLSFVKDDSKKIAYAASIGSDLLSDEQLEIMRPLINTFAAISVRESDAKQMLTNITEIPITVCVDPVFLLERNQWDEICSQRLIDEKYCYCHFIGDDQKLRKSAEEYAKKHGLKIVTIPHPSRYNVSDKNFGDYRFISATPKDFISLIKYSDVVFTDSFHCCAFSFIYEKNVFAFHRAGKRGMASRIKTLFSYFKAEDHFCVLDANGEDDVTWFDGKKDIDFNNREEFEVNIERSKRFLQKEFKKKETL